LHGAQVYLNNVNKNSCFELLLLQDTHTHTYTHAHAQISFNEEKVLPSYEGQDIYVF